MQSTLSSDLKNSIFDGIFANIYATLTGGLFLTGFALYLGMNEFMIGLLSAIPFLATTFQIPASYLLETTGHRKKLANRSALTARVLWLPILVIALIPGISYVYKSIIVLVIIFFVNALISVSFVSWLSWISDIVPENMRGRFFGTRNMLCGAAGMTAMLLFGNLLDHMKDRGRLTLGFSVILISAVLFGILSVRFQKKIHDPAQHNAVRREVSFRKGILLPFRDVNFRNFILFSSAWSFSVYFASPFFTLYFLRELNFSYSFVAFLGTLSALSDLLGMHLWGRISDKVKNKAVIHVASWVAVFLPLAWATIVPGSRIMPVILHIIGGGFWAGINLCMNNLLFKIAPNENKSFYLSAFNIAGGFGAAISPVIAGLILKSLDGVSLSFLTFPVVPLQLIFLASTLFRLLSSRLLLKRINEPEEVAPIQVIRIIRNIRTLNIASGFNHLLHPFVEIFRETETTAEK